MLLLRETIKNWTFKKGSLEKQAFFLKTVAVFLLVARVKLGTRASSGNNKNASNIYWLLTSNHHFGGTSIRVSQFRSDF